MSFSVKLLRTTIELIFVFLDVARYAAREALPLAGAP
jgi:hypothetical protein